jgi:hypothetical protein
MKKKIQNCNMGIKKRRKIRKNPREKSYQQKSDRKLEFLAFLTACKSCQPLRFWVIFCTFATELNSASNFLFYDTHIEFLKKTFFAYISTFC